MMKYLILLLILFISAPLSSQINPDNITIIRDQWGVPHIYGKTDAEAAYGLAWATAEDDFKTMQETLMPIHGLLGRHKGPEGAIMDFLVEVIDLNASVDSRYESDISPHYKKILEAYCAAINDFAKKHPKQVISKKLFPLNGRDVIKGYVLAITILASVQNDIARIISGNINLFENEPKGSNAFAVNSNKTKDGQTYLAVNPHQPLEGLYSWYEAHMVSEEGLNVLGATLLGGVNITVGANENLAWTHTVNHADFTDVYKLVMHKTEKNKYFYDGKWEMLEVEKVKLKVKILGLKLPVKRKIYRSKHGRVLKSKNGNYYAIRFTSNRTVKGAEQWYMMNKAKNFTEFKSALRRLGVCTTNLVYTDREDNIFYTGLGLFPKRNPKFDWEKVLPGHTSEAVWEDDFVDFDELPQVLNPPSGYVGNCNNTPFNATTPEYNIKPTDINSTLGYMTGDNNRSLRYHYLMGQKDKISYEEFKEIKFDKKWHTPAHVYSFPNLEILLTLDPAKYPKLADVIQNLNQWNRDTDVNNVGAATFALTYHYIIKDLAKRGYYPTEFPLTEPYVIKMLQKARKHMKKHFKKVDVTMGELHQHIRGDKVIPMWGSPNVIAAMYGKPYKKGRFKIFAGESYVSLIRFTEEGVQIESVVPYGTSTHPESPHYDDQMEIYSQQKLKKMSMNKDEIIKNATRTYHPK